MRDMVFVYYTTILDKIEIEAIRGAGAQNVTVMGSIPTRGNKLFI